MASVTHPVGEVVVPDEITVDPFLIVTFAPTILVVNEPHAVDCTQIVVLQLQHPHPLPFLGVNLMPTLTIRR